MKRRKRKIKRSKVQYFRYLALAMVIGFFILVPLSNRYANFKISYNQARLVALSDGPVAGKIYQAMDSFYSLWDDPVTAATSNNGSLWAFTVLGVPLSDPLGLISELINSVHFPWKYLIGGFIPFLVAIMLGRAFCSWLCPMVVLFGATEKIRNFLEKYRVPLLRVRLEEGTRAVLFWLGLVISYFWGAWIWHFILPYIAFTHEIFSYVVFQGFTVGVYVLIAVLVLDIGLIPGEFCRNVCPTGFLLAWIGKFRVLKLSADSQSCPKKCRTCETVCPIDLYPKEDKLHSCHLCYICVDNCPKQHIELKVNPLYKNIFSENSFTKKISNMKTLPVLLAISLTSLFSSTGQAHHYKGLPHYSYFENYPQVPMLEFIKETPQYEVFVTIYNFQGLNLDMVESPDDVRFYVYIYDVQGNKTYVRPAEFSIYSHDELVYESGQINPEQESIYVLQGTVEKQDKLRFSVKLTDGSGAATLVELPISLKKTFLEKWGVGMAIGLFFALVISIKLFISRKPKETGVISGPALQT